MKRFIIQIVLKTTYGDFKGEKITVNEEQYVNVEGLSKLFYNSGFEMNLENGGLLVLPPEVVKNSILIIEKEEIK